MIASNLELHRQATKRDSRVVTALIAAGDDCNRPSVARKCHDFSTDLVALKRCEVREVGVKYP